MDEDTIGTIALTVLSLSILSVFMGMFIWGIRSGQFKNPEEVKYHIFTGDEKEDGRSDQHHEQGE